MNNFQAKRSTICGGCPHNTGKCLLADKQIVDLVSDLTAICPDIPPRWGQVLEPSAVIPNDTPSNTEIVVNFVSAAASHVMNGMKSVDDSERSRREQICKTCPHMSGNRCNKCGCFLAVKIAWESSNCPIGKW